MKHKITVEFTEDEAMMVMASAETLRENYAEAIARPRYGIRRAIRHGLITEKSIKERYHDARSVQNKIRAALVESYKEAKNDESI